MKITAKKKVASARPRELPAEIAALFAKAPPIDTAAARDLESAARGLDLDPAFVAGYHKELVVEDILRALEETGISKIELAKRIGKTRQYVSHVLNGNARVNFTIDTLAQFSVALDRQLCVRILPASTAKPKPNLAEPEPKGRRRNALAAREGKDCL